ncbi:hypothetical protein HNP46_000262 [Pseudomonas nitritireducens]|uniref:Uncharacterized protein n=1 Tax=Pseudomonas nitroreducens TaxID=46680 RepID=A0A7W7KFG7_PSENT|nr:hypothetical protein [Pseudomonas nitritireducens]MBB4861451.1 hypothetical protein [Pseudomonas nitritireducens]
MADLNGMRPMQQSGMTINTMPSWDFSAGGQYAWREGEDREAFLQAFQNECKSFDAVGVTVGVLREGLVYSAAQGKAVRSSILATGGAGRKVVYAKMELKRR